MEMFYWTSREIGTSVVGALVQAGSARIWPVPEIVMAEATSVKQALGALLAGLTRPLMLNVAFGKYMMPEMFQIGPELFPCPPSLISNELLVSARFLS